MFCTRTQLPLLLVYKAGLPWLQVERQLRRICLPLQKFIDLLLIFLVKNRARRVEQFTTLCQ